MEDFTRKLITEWRRLDLPFEDETILIAVSGGADSCALAQGLADLRDQKKLGNRFIVGHYNHNLRGESSIEDVDFTREFAEKNGFGFVIGSQKQELPKNENLEQAARKARYRFLLEKAEEFGCFAVLTGHTQNDQAETLLLNLIRGAGIDGLSGMKVSRFLTDNSGNSKAEDKFLLVRPLLNWAKREDTEDFARSRHIDFCEDSMNQDKGFSRVRVRKELIPSLESYNPKIIETLAKTAAILRDDSELLKEIYDENTLPTEKLPVKLLKTIGEPKFKRCVRAWLKEKRGDLRSIDQKHVNAIVSLASSRKSGSVCELPKREKVIKRKGELIFIGSEVEKIF